MRVTISAGKARGVIAAPPSKSAGHRLLIAASLTRGVSVISGLGLSEDILATEECLRALGAGIKSAGNDTEVTGIFAGSGEERHLPCAEKNPPDLPVRESGSTLRFLIPAALFLSGAVRFTGSERLLERPLSVYEDIFRRQGVLFRKEKESLFLSGNMGPGYFRIPGNISSQFITGLLFVLPLLQEESIIEIVPPFESRSYVEMTLEVLSGFGIRVIREGGLKFRIPGRQEYRPFRGQAEGDYSNAAFFEVLNLFGGEVRLTGLRTESLQGDAVYRTMFPALREGPLEADLSDCPDLAPVLFAAAAASYGGHFTGTKRLRYKESDRAEAMKEELLKFGVPVEIAEDSVTVPGGYLRKPLEPLSGHNDHRIVMALSCLLTLTGGTIDGAEAVRKSLPEFFSMLQSLGIEVQTDGMDQ